MPTAYTGAKAFPLIVALHGLGGTEDAFFDNYEKKLPPLAESHGYIVAAPLGYRVDGSYGWGLGTAAGGSEHEADAGFQRAGRDAGAGSACGSSTRSTTAAST